MEYQDVMQALEAAGKAQTRKTYARHGVGEPLFGVSYAELKRLEKKIKCDHPLAEALWESGVHDARILATTVADPLLCDHTLAEKWVSQVDNYVLADAVSQMLSRSPYAEEYIQLWWQTESEWASTIAWNILGNQANDSTHPDAFFIPFLDSMRTTIHERPNRTRHAMNMALIAIGSRTADLAQQATAIAEQIGPVQVDHGATNCTTPDPIDYIRKTRAHRLKKTQKV